MDSKSFDFTLADAQGTEVEPLSVRDFDFDAYAEYAAVLDERCAKFEKAESGVLVCRRFRVPGVFSAACGDRELSLRLQLGALKASMDYPMDVPNFLEPWYGIGTVAAAFGGTYLWNQGQAPAVEPPFASVREALEREPVPVAETGIGRHILGMIEYFLDASGGKIPLSFSDVQSPLNAASALVETSEFFMSVLDEPELVGRLLDLVTDLSLEFYRKQLGLIGGALASPGHGFSSSRVFVGIGASDDSSTMLSPEMYRELVAPRMERFGEASGGIAYHSCGNWSGKIGAVKGMRGLRTVDAAFTSRTDPDPNPPEAFREAFSGTGICVNARMVGDADEVLSAFGRLWDPGMKLVAVTYCATKEEQARVYEGIREAAR